MEQVKNVFSKWNRTAGMLLIGSGTAWIIKLSVIISTNGRVIETGAAAFFMAAGMLLLLIGSTGIGFFFSRRRAVWLRVLAILCSPVLVVGSFFVFGLISSRVFQNSSIWYAQQEAPIAFAAVTYLAVGFLLYKSGQHAPLPA